MDKNKLHGSAVASSEWRYYIPFRLIRAPRLAWRGLVYLRSSTQLKLLILAYVLGIQHTNEDLEPVEQATRLHPQSSETSVFSNPPPNSRNGRSIPRFRAGCATKAKNEKYTRSISLLSPILKKSNSYLLYESNTNNSTRKNTEEPGKPRTVHT